MSRQGISDGTQSLSFGAPSSMAGVRSGVLCPTTVTELADANSKSAPHSADRASEIPCIWYFLPLPHPLPVPDKLRSEEPMSAHELARSSTPVSGLASSLLIHQLDDAHDRFRDDLVQLWAFASATMKEGDPSQAERSFRRFFDESGSREDGLAARRTVAEVAVLGLHEENAAEILRGLDIAIDHVRFVQRAVAGASQSPVRLLARATLPPAVPIFAGVVWPQPAAVEGMPPKPLVRRVIEMLIPGCAPPTVMGVRAAEFDDDMMNRLWRTADMISAKGAFSIYIDLRREAMVQREFDGNLRMAALAVATAGEVLLDTVLLHMLWEEQMEPGKVPEYLDRSISHSLRIRKFIPPRLGGRWTHDAKTPAGRYLRDVVWLRHRVVHAGHETTQREMDDSWTALVELEAYVGDRLAEGKNLRKYPRTAVAWMGEQGLSRRERLTKHVQQLLDEPTEPNWIEAFSRWRHYVDRALDSEPDTPGSDPNAVAMYADLQEDGSIRWILYDSLSDFAALAPDPRAMVAPERIDEVTQYFEGHPPLSMGDRRIAIALGGPIPPGLEWRAGYEVFPEMRLFPGR